MPGHQGCVEGPCETPENHPAEDGKGSQGCILQKPHKMGITAFTLQQQNQGSKKKKSLLRFRPTRCQADPVYNFLIPKSALLAR